MQNSKKTIQENETIEDEIIKMVNDSWDQEKKLVLLARIGQHLNRSGLDLKGYLKGKKLASEINHGNLGKKIKLVTSPQDKLVHAAAPINAELSSELEIYFKKDQELKAKEKNIKFNKIIWIAFTRPLNENKDRFIKIVPDLSFQDIQKGTEVPDIFLDRKFIVFDEIPRKSDRDLNVEKNIMQWAKENQIDIEDIKEKDFDRNSKTEKICISMLEKIISSLDSSELKRISLPLDIVKKLNNLKI